MGGPLTPWAGCVFHGRTSDGGPVVSIFRLPNRIIPKEATRQRGRNPPFMAC